MLPLFHLLNICLGKLSYRKGLETSVLEYLGRDQNGGEGGTVAAWSGVCPLPGAGADLCPWWVLYLS